MVPARDTAVVPRVIKETGQRRLRNGTLEGDEPVYKRNFRDTMEHFIELS